MWIIAVVVSIASAIFSTAVMSYITMATPIGPWIASTLVLIAMLLFKLIKSESHESTSEKIALVTVAGSVGGIIATALGFSFPTLYFLDPLLFNTWMANPFYFISVVAGLSLVGGWFGFWIANIFEHKFIVQEQLAYPIGQLVNKMITAQQNVRKAWELVTGFFGTTVFCFLQDGIGLYKGFLPKTVTLVSSFSMSVFRVPLIPLDLWPLLWAIGFVTGHVIALPLAVGALSKVLLVDPLNLHFFPSIKNIEFILAFCSGMVLAGALQGLIDTPQLLWTALKKTVTKKEQITRSNRLLHIECSYVLEALAVIFACGAFFTYFGFTTLMQIYVLAFTFICTYQIAWIAGQIGLAQLGRFATFVMVPALFLFTLDSVQIVLIATFVELSGGVAADILFGRKVAQLERIASKKIKAYQYLGLVVGALTAGCVFWLLINHFQLGSPELFAQRAQARQLLIGVKSFNYYILLIGVIFGLFLKLVKMNPMLVLGGLLMPLNISIGLIIGGFASILTKNKEKWYPFWSGVFAANSIWMLVKAII